MQDITPEEASEWLREYYADGSAPEITLTWIVGEPNPPVYQEVMEVLFGP